MPKIKYLMMAVAMLGGMLPLTSKPANAASCPELKIIFARGSGGERWEDKNYRAFVAGLESKLVGSGIDYEFEDLDYPAVGIGDPLVMIGALLGGGEVYEFGRSVNAGVDSLVAEVNGACSDTKYVVAGYSQGAMVVSKALRELESERVIYAATFGDPKIYLPEGAGLMPVACQGYGLSDYRMYVPDCRAYLGKLGTYLPYQPEGFVGKMGTWCNRTDIFCSSYLSRASHTAYVDDGLYEDAAWVIYGKIAEAFSVEDALVTPHDTAILIDSTVSMIPLISQYKDEALRLAAETLEAGGRVALYEYRDYQGKNALTRRCDFGCTLEEFRMQLMMIQLSGGGDVLESTLGASLAVMQELEWQRGAVKSLVILTDAGYHDPDFDSRRTTLADVVRLSKQIDPVNIYVVTTEETAAEYGELTSATGGRVVTSVGELAELTDKILARHDALPRVEEWLDDGEELPWAEVVSMVMTGANATVKFRSSSGRAMVALNDVFLGVVEGEEVTITGLDADVENVLMLVPISEMRSGASVSVALEDTGYGEMGEVFVPRVPDTGMPR